MEKDVFESQRTRQCAASRSDPIRNSTGQPSNPGLLKRVPNRPILFLLLVVIATVIATLVVIFSTHRQSNFVCEMTFRTIVSNNQRPSSHPIAIACGDFNNDNAADVVVANSAIDSIGILIGDGVGSFVSMPPFSTGIDSYPCAVTVCDVDGDQQLDIIVANRDTHTVDMFRGDGRGNFVLHASRNTGSAQPVHVAVGDFDQDNRSDIVVVNHGADTISLLLAKNNHRFETINTYFTGFDSSSRYAVVADVNVDARLDVVIANYGTSTIGILFGRGDGTLLPQMTVFTGLNSQPYTLAVADVNNDAFPDIAVACSGSQTVGVFLGDANGTFMTQLWRATGSPGPVHLAITDFNNDAMLDLAVALANQDTVRIFLGYGNGSFADAFSYPTGYGSYPLSIVVADFNRDNRSDVAVANNATNNVAVLLGYDPGALQSQVTYATNSILRPIAVAVGFINNDTYLDIVAANNGAGSMGVFLGVGDGTFGKQAIFSTGANSLPYTVAIGDMNNDNRADVVVANYRANNVGILFGLGNGTFGQMVAYSAGTGAGTNAAAVGDFNNDRWLDIAAVNFDAGNVGVFLGRGNGTFVNQTTYSTGSGSGPYAVTVGDIDGDQNLDILAANSYLNNVGVFYGFGNGTFPRQVGYATGFNSRPYAVVVYDLNGDGRLDIITSNRRSDTVGVLLGLGNRTFTPIASYKTGPYYTPFSVAIGDFNADGRPDIAAVSRDVSVLGVFLGLGNGTFGAHIPYPLSAGARPYAVACGDFNGDHRSDIVIANYNASNVGVFLARDFGALMSQVMYPTGSAARPVSVVLGDFNSDQQTDVVVANFETNTVGVLLQHDTGAFANQSIYSTGSSSNPNALAVGDFDMDDRSDIAVANYASGTIGVFLGHGNGSLQSQLSYSTGVGSFPASIAVADLNGDNRSDVVVANSGSNNLGVFLADIYTSFKPPTTYSTGSESVPLTINSGDFNNDTYPDIVVANSVTANIMIYLGLGNGSFDAPSSYATGVGSKFYSIAVGDLNGDNRVDLVVANYALYHVGVFLGYGNGSFDKQVTYSTGASSSPNSVIIADLNSDNLPDIAVTNLGTGTFGVLLGFGNGSFASQVTYSMGSSSQPYALAVGDFNNDNRSDIVVAYYGNVSIGIFLGFGNGTFVRHRIYVTATQYGPYSVTVGYFNNDTFADIAIGNYDDSNIGVFLGLGNGMFANQTKYSTGAGTCPYTVLTGDFNNDQRVDLATATYYGNALEVFLGYGDGTFGRQQSYWIHESSFSQSLVLADFNGDQLLDVVVANSGTADMSVFLAYCCEPFQAQTTYSTGNQSRPFSATIDQLNNDAQWDIVVANSNARNIGVLFGYGNGSFAKQMTYSLDSDYPPFALAIADVNKDERRDIIVGSYAAEYIIVLINVGEGSFVQFASYSVGVGAQTSAIVVGDFNKDRRLDIAVSNDATNNIGLLYGYDNGTFAEVVPYSTGFGSLPSSVAVGDLNKDMQADIVIASRGKNTIEILSKFC